MLGTIEQAIVDAIDAAAKKNGKFGYTYDQVASYGDELDDNLAIIIKSFPACWVVLKGEATARIDQFTDAHSPTFSIIVGCSSRRNEKAARHGTEGEGGEVGAYQRLEDIRALLFRNDLDLDIDPIQPGAIRPLLNGKAGRGHAAIYALEISTGYETRLPDATGLDDLQTFHADWDLPPHGNVTKPLPAAESDAADTVTLNEEA
ncbi:MAG: phage protein Gp37 [Magnetovibrionaceae bacterium]